MNSKHEPRLNAGGIVAEMQVYIQGVWSGGEFMVGERAGGQVSGKGWHKTPRHSCTCTRAVCDHIFPSASFSLTMQSSCLLTISWMVPFCQPARQLMFLPPSLNLATVVGNVCHTLAHIHVYSRSQDSPLPGIYSESQPVTQLRADPSLHGRLT